MICWLKARDNDVDDTDVGEKGNNSGMKKYDMSEFDYFAEGDTFSDGRDTICYEVGRMSEVINTDASFHAEENIIQSDPKYLTELVTLMMR